MIKTLEWSEEGVRFLDQTRLPAEEVYVTCATPEQVAEAIRTMVVRGAPALGVAAAMGVAVGVKNSSAKNAAELGAEIHRVGKLIAATRPTAVNLFWGIERMRRKFEAMDERPLAEIKRELIAEAKRMHVEDIAANQAMGRHGATLMPAS